MSSYSFTDGVAIAQVIFYGICLPITLFVCSRHGLSKAAGWYFLMVFATVRIIGNVSELVARTQGPESTAAIIYAVTAFVGLSPLLLASLGLLTRLYNSVEYPSSFHRARTAILRLLQIVCLVALILCIVGATSGTPATLYDQTPLRAGVGLYAAVWAALALLVFAVEFTASGKRYEKPIFVALTLSLPVLLVRVIYSLIRVFGPRGPGTILSDPTKAEFLALFLGALEEMFVVVAYLTAGFLTERVLRQGRTSNSHQFV